MSRPGRLVASLFVLFIFTCLNAGSTISSEGIDLAPLPYTIVFGDDSSDSSDKDDSSSKTSKDEGNGTKKPPKGQGYWSLVEEGQIKNASVSSDYYRNDYTSGLPDSNTVTGNYWAKADATTWHKYEEGAWIVKYRWSDVPKTLVPGETPKMSVTIEVESNIYPPSLSSTTSANIVFGSLDTQKPPALMYGGTLASTGDVNHTSAKGGYAVTGKTSDMPKDQLATISEGKSGQKYAIEIWLGPSWEYKVRYVYQWVENK